MADDPKDDLDIDVEGSGLALRTEMAVSEFLLRYWKQIAGTIVAGIVVLVVYGQWSNLRMEEQRRTAGQIADAEATLEQPLLYLAEASVRPETEVDLETVASAADELVAIAEGGTGTASIEAALKAAELYRVAGDDAKRRAALEMAAADAEGVLRFSAVAALAHLDLEEGRADEGLTLFRELAQLKDPFLAREATLELAMALESLERWDEAVATYDTWLSSWPDADGADDVQAKRARAAEQAG